MNIPRFHFTKSWINSEDFPLSVNDEAAARANMQALYTEIETWINEKLVPGLSTALTENDVVNNLTTLRTSVPLSAAQGKVLKDSADALAKKVPANALGKADIVNSLVSSSTDRPLSAAQGKALNDIVTTLRNSLNRVEMKNFGTNGSYPVAFDMGFEPDFAIVDGRGANDESTMAVSFVNGAPGAGATVSLITGKGLVRNWQMGIEGTKIKITKSGDNVGNAHNIPGRYEKVIAIKFGGDK